MVTINSTDNFLKDFASTCKNVQKKSFKKNQTITTYIQKRNQICIILSGEADLVRYDMNGDKTIIEHFTKNDIFGEALYIVTTNNELSVEAKKVVKFCFLTIIIFIKNVEIIVSSIRLYLKTFLI